MQWAVSAYPGHASQQADYNNTQESNRQQMMNAQFVYLLVRGMGCPTCAMRVRTALLDNKGVLDAVVLLLPGVALVHYDPEQVNLDDLPKAVQGAGHSSRHDYSARVLDCWP